VEDAPGVRALAKAGLESQGYVVLEASDGADALRVFKEFAGNIDLLVTDLVMPGMSGSQLAEELRGMRSETKVLYMSGYTNDVAIRHGLVGSSVAYLPKPFTPRILAEKVRQVLDAHPVH